MSLLQPDPRHIIQKGMHSTRLATPDDWTAFACYRGRSVFSWGKIIQMKTTFFSYSTPSSSGLLSSNIFGSRPSVKHTNKQRTPLVMSRPLWYSSPGFTKTWPCWSLTVFLRQRKYVPPPSYSLTLVSIACPMRVKTCKKQAELSTKPKLVPLAKMSKKNLTCVITSIIVHFNASMMGFSIDGLIK